MFGSMKKNVDNPARDIETIIGKDTVITGNLSSQGNIRVDGRVEGDLSISGDTVIGENGNVQGNIKTGSLTVAGMVTGNVDCEGNLSIHSSGQLIGDVHVRSLNIEDGGIFKGRSEMDTRAFGGRPRAFRRSLDCILIESQVLRALCKFAQRLFYCFFRLTVPRHAYIMKSNVVYSAREARRT